MVRDPQTMAPRALAGEAKKFPLGLKTPLERRCATYYAQEKLDGYPEEPARYPKSPSPWGTPRADGLFFMPPEMSATSRVESLQRRVARAGGPSPLCPSWRVAMSSAQPKNAFPLATSHQPLATALEPSPPPRGEQGGFCSAPLPADRHLRSASKTQSHASMVLASRRIARHFSQHAEIVAKSRPPPPRQNGPFRVLRPSFPVSLFLCILLWRNKS